MLLEVGGSFAIEEAAGPGELLAHRTRPNHGRQCDQQGPLELGSFAWTKPSGDSFNYSSKVGSRCGLPEVQRLLALNDDWALDSSDADDPLELGEDPRHAVQPSLVDPRLDTTAAPVCPSLAIEESRGPCKVVALQPRDLDRNTRACMSPKRAKTSSKCASAVARMCAASLR